MLEKFQKPKPGSKAFNCGNDCTVEFTITHDSIAGNAGEYVIAMDLNNFAQGVATTQSIELQQLKQDLTQESLKDQ